MSKMMTPQQAYLAMYAFLNAYYQRGPADEIAIILSNMTLCPDGSTSDPAYANDWNVAVEAALSGKIDAQIRLVNHE